MPRKSLINSILRNRKGQGLVEYALLIAGVALVSIVAISLFGEKTGDMISAVATVLPGADSDDNAPIAQGHLIETTSGSAELRSVSTSRPSCRIPERLGWGTMWPVEPLAAALAA